MAKNKICKKLLLVLVLVVATICVFTNIGIFASANSEINCPEIYKEIATNFFESQYNKRNIEYTNLSVALEADLYNSEEEVVAKALVMKRDDTYDYVTLNIATAEIDEFVFDDDTAIDKFSQKVYYTGVLNYFTNEADNYRSVYSDEISYSKNEFKKISSWINEKFSQLKSSASKKYRSDKNPIPNPSKTGYNGFYSYSEILTFNVNNGYVNLTDSNYLEGIDNNGIKDPALSFVSQNTIKTRLDVDNACGPTALTNMFIWFQYRNIENKDGIVNALKSGDVFETFKDLAILVYHSNQNGTMPNRYDDALRDYASKQNYNFELRSNLKTYKDFKGNIDCGRPILTSINLSSWGGHAVLTVGYEQFEYRYSVKHQFLWKKWTTIESDYTNYLRVIDGWNTSNSSRYIDLSGYWDSVIGRSFIIKH